MDHRFRRINADGAEVLRLLQQIYDASFVANDGFWALRMRPQIRRVQFLNRRAVLVLVIKMTADERMRLLAVWLRGRCGGYLGTSTIASLGHSSDFRMQKECVRVLQRLNAWAELREIATAAKHPRVRDLAIQRAVKPLNERLSSVLANIRPIETTPRKIGVWLLPGLVLGYTAPKSIDTIRSRLERIKQLVIQSNAPAKSRRDVFYNLWI